VFVTCLLPVAFINFYPARLLMGKITPGESWYWLSYMSPLVALTLLSLAAALWKRALRQYSSIGS
jgi:ABC-2 type transport system permease protein